jgi:hypothetical protein
MQHKGQVTAMHKAKTLDIVLKWIYGKLIVIQLVRGRERRKEKGEREREGGEKRE